MAIDTGDANYVRSLPDWARMRDVLAGQTAMRQNALDYLRRPLGLTDNEEWERYVAATPFFEATLRTLEGLTGLAFYRDPEITLPDSMKPFVDDCTQDGVPLRQFTEKVFEEVLGMARVGVLVDYPVRDESLRSLRDEEAAARRPFLRRYRTEDIFHVETGLVDGAVALTQVRLREIETEKTGDWSMRWRKRIRVLELVKLSGAWTYRQRIFTHGRWETEETEQPVAEAGAGTPAMTPATEAADDWTEGPMTVPEIEKGKPFGYIPFWIINPTDQSPEIRRPPLLGLANVNVSHFSTSAALENALFWAGNPQPYICGLDPKSTKQFRVGSSEAWIFESHETKVDFLSFGADNLVPLEKRLDRLEQHMAVLGAKMLSVEQRGVEAAETARIHRQGEISVLAGVCGSVSRAMFDICVVVCEWQGQAVDKLAFKIITAFYDQTITLADALDAMKLWQAGFLAPEDVLALMKKGEIVAGNRTLESIVSDNQSSPIQPIMPGLTDNSIGSSPGEPPKPPAPKPAPVAAK